MDSNMHVLVDVISRNISFLNNYILENYKDIYYSFLHDEFDYYTFSIITFAAFMLFVSLGLSIYAMYIFYKYTGFHIGNTQDTNDTKNIKKQGIIVKKGLYSESIIELFNNNISITKNTEKYQVLLRVKLLNNLNLRKTKYDLHSNNLIGDINLDPIFTTKDLFMIVNIYNNYNFTIENNIVRVMNYINQTIIPFLKTDDFVIVMVSKNNTKTDEFIQGLKNNNYTVDEHLITASIPKMKINNSIIPAFQVLFTLPIHEVYDVFADTFNETIFESKNYVMDNDNYESWKTKSINDIKTF